METITIELTAVQTPHPRPPAREEGPTAEQWAGMIISDAMAPFLTFTLNAVGPGGASLQFYCTHERVYQVATGLDEAQTKLYKQLAELLQADGWGNRRKAVGLLKKAGFV